MIGAVEVGAEAAEEGVSDGLEALAAGSDQNVTFFPPRLSKFGPRFARARIVHSSPTGEI